MLGRAAPQCGGQAGPAVRFLQLALRTVSPALRTVTGSSGEKAGETGESRRWYLRHLPSVNPGSSKWPRAGVP